MHSFFNRQNNLQKQGQICLFPNGEQEFVCYQAVSLDSDHLNHLRTQGDYFLPDQLQIELGSSLGTCHPQRTFTTTPLGSPNPKNNLVTHKSLVQFSVVMLDLQFCWTEDHPIWLTEGTSAVSTHLAEDHEHMDIKVSVLRREKNRLRRGIKEAFEIENRPSKAEAS